MCDAEDVEDVGLVENVIALLHHHLRCGGTERNQKRPLGPRHAIREARLQKAQPFLGMDNKRWISDNVGVTMEISLIHALSTRNPPPLRHVWELLVGPYAKIWEAMGK